MACLADLLFKTGMNFAKGECVSHSNYASDLQFNSVTVAIL